MLVNKRTCCIWCCFLHWNWKHHINAKNTNEWKKIIPNLHGYNAFNSLQNIKNQKNCKQPFPWTPRNKRRFQIMNNKHGFDSNLIPTSKRLILTMSIDSWIKDPIWESNKRKNFQSILCNQVKRAKWSTSFIYVSSKQQTKNTCSTQIFCCWSKLVWKLAKKTSSTWPPTSSHSLETFYFHNTQP